MNNNNATSMDPYNDEISIGELIEKLWRKRGLIVFLPLVLAGLTVAGLLLTKATSPEKLSYYIELTGLKDNAYPNGTAFSPQDLLNPQVTAELGQRFPVKDVGGLGKSIQVEFGTPLSAGVLTEYRAALSANSKASPEEIALINQRYEERVTATARRGLRIEVDYTGLGLTKSQGTELAYALPQVWNQVFSSRFRIFMDAGIASLPTVEADVDITTTVGALEAELQLTSIKEGIGILKEDARFRALEADGVSPGDLERKITDFQRIYFDPIYSGTFSEESGLSAIYRRDLVLELAELDASLEELNERITAITELQRTTTGNDAGRNDFNSGSSQVQIEGDALNQLVTLSRTASLAEYLQASFDERIELIQQKATINTRLQKMGDSSGSGSLLSENFLMIASARLENIVSLYASLLTEAQATARRETPTLYAVTSQIQGEKLIERRDGLYIALALALGGMIAIVIALLLPGRPNN